MKQVGAAEFKAKCLQLLDAIEPEGLLITKHGRPVARLMPWRPGSGALIGALRGKLKVHGDLLSTGVRWHAES